MNGRPQGFTLIEALICLAICSLLLAVAVSFCSSAFARADASAARTALLASLTEAIRHAATTGVEVVLCPGDQTGCRNSFDWSEGWIVYADLDGNRRRTQQETLLRQQPPLSRRVRLLSTTGRRRLVIQPTGGNAGSNVTFTLCDSRGPQSTVSLVLSNRGRLRAAPATRRCALR